MIAAIPDTIPRAALITGGETVLGLTLAHALADAGFAIALQCHAPTPGEPPDGSEILRADLSVETRAATLLGRAVARIGPIGVLVHAAGTEVPEGWDEPGRAVWDAHFETGVRAPFILSRQFAAALPAESEGVAIMLVDPRLTARSLSWTLANAALWTLTRTMALALAPRIRVNAISTAGTGEAVGGVAEADANAVAGVGAAADRDGRVTHVMTGGVGPLDAVASAALATLALPSMTGQMMVPHPIQGRATWPDPRHAIGLGRTPSDG